MNRLGWRKIWAGAELARQVQQVTGHTVKVASADQGYTGKEPAQAALDEGIEVQVIKLEEGKRALYRCPGGG